MKYKNSVYFFILALPCISFSGNSSPRPSAFTKLLKDCSPEELLERAQHAAAKRISNEIESKNIPLANVSEKLNAMLNFSLYRTLYFVSVYGKIYEKCFLKGVLGKPDTTIWIPSNLTSVPNNPNMLSAKSLPFKITASETNKIDTDMATLKTLGTRREREA